MPATILDAELRGAFSPSALTEGLSGWVILLKDLLKKTAIAHGEARLMLGSLAFLRVYEWRDAPAASAGGHRSIFDGLFSALAQEVAQLRQIHEGVRDDLVILEMLLLHERTYEDLSRPDADDPDADFEVLRRPKSWPEKERHRRYVAALRVLWTTSLTDASPVVMGAIRKVLEGWPEKLFERSMVARTLRIITDAHQRHVRDAGAPGAPPFVEPNERGQIVKVLSLLQEQPYCQPERIRLANPTDDASFHEEMRAWIRQSAGNDRLGDLLHQAMRIPQNALIHDALRVAFDERLSVAGFMEYFTKGAMQPGPDSVTSTEALRELGRLWLARLARQQELHQDPGRPLADVLVAAARDEVAEIVVEIVDLVVEIAESCWHIRMARVLERVARFRQGDIVEIEGAPLSAIHGYLFRRVAIVHAQCDDAFASLRRMSQSIQQRGSILPPGFPAVPRQHRREREAVESMLLDVLERMQENTEALFRYIRPDPPSITVELSFEYAYTSEVRVISPARNVKTVTVIVPFFTIELPRYMADVVHEIAHAFAANDELGWCLQSPPDRWEEAVATGGWDSRVMEIMRVTGQRLRECYVRHGVASLDECGLIAEVLADFVALLVVGPYYLYSLLFATVGVADLPTDADGEAPPETYGAEVSPMVRIGALLTVMNELRRGWRGATVGFFSEPGLEPVSSIWKAYFRVLHDRSSDDWVQLGRLRIFQEEMEILGDGLIHLLRWLRREAKCQGRELPVPKPARVTPDPDGPFPWASRAARRIDEMLGELSGDAAGTDAYLVVGAAKDEPRFLKDNIIHMLWSSVLSRHLRAGRVFERTRALGDLTAALWRRTPEVRPMTGLLTGARADRPDLPSAGELVTVVQVDAFWWSRDRREPSHPGLSGAFDDVRRGGGRWVAGDHDLHFVVPRRHNIELLSQPEGELLARLPAQPRYCYLRSFDYWMGPAPNSWGKGIASAFFQIRLKAYRDHACFPDAVQFAELVDGLGVPGAWRGGPLLQSFGWDHYAITLDFERWTALSRWWLSLRQTLANRGMRVEYHAMNILHDPLRTGEDVAEPDFSCFQPLGPSTSPDVTFISRARCRGDHLQDPEARRRLTDLCLSYTKAGTRVLWAEASGYDDLELRIEAGAPSGPKDGQRRQSLQLYAKLVDHLIRSVRAFDVQTIVLLPEP